MLKQILISLGIVLLVSAGIASAAYFFHISFWGTFIISTILQIIFFYVYNGYMQNKNSLTLERLTNERITELAKQGTIVNCAFCQHPNFVFLRFDADNILECDKCNKKSSVYITVEAAQITTPVSTIQAATLPQIVVDELAQIAMQENPNK